MEPMSWRTSQVFAGIAFIIGGLFAAFVILFLLLGWHELHCGINDFNLSVGSSIAAFLLTVGNVLWRSDQPIEKRSKLRHAFVPLWIFGGIIVYLSIDIPVCPFLSR